MSTMKNIAYINPTPNLNFPHNRLKQFKKKKKKERKKPTQGFKCSTGRSCLEVSLCKQMVVLHKKREENSSYSACRQCGLQSLWVSSLSWMSRCSVWEFPSPQRWRTDMLIPSTPHCSEEAYRGLIPHRHTKLSASDEMCALNTKIMFCIQISAFSLVRLFIKDHWMLSFLPSSLPFNPTQAATLLWSW